MKSVVSSAQRGSILRFQPSRRQTLLAGALVPLPLSAASSSQARAANSYKSEVTKILDELPFPAEGFPFAADAFQRYDESSDKLFYEAPRFVTHIDDPAINALTKWYGEKFPPSGSKDVAILDICSSWISHYPAGYTAGRIAGLGMNEAELKRNEQITEYAVRDLNEDPRLPYEDNSFDFVTNAVSVDYLTKPLEIFREMHRVLKPGGTAAMSFSNRYFPTKCVAIWTVSLVLRF